MDWTVVGSNKGSIKERMNTKNTETKQSGKWVLYPLLELKLNERVENIYNAITKGNDQIIYRII